jgi:hypothetical protein
MAVSASFFKHSNFNGYSESFNLSNNWRYWWIKFGSGLRNEITSMRATAYSGFDGNVYGFTRNDFLGQFASLNMGEGWTCWWSNVGGELNDDIESALLINRNKSEFALELKGQISGTFKTELDKALADSQAKRNGEPRVYSVFWPSYDPSKKFVRVEQNLTIELDWWPDYDARIRYDVYLYLNSAGKVQGYVAWAHTWVEGGIFSGDILDELHPKVVAGASDLNGAIQDQLAVFSFFTFSSLYLLPGPQPPMPPPSSNFGRIGNALDDATLVLVS